MHTKSKTRHLPAATSALGALLLGCTSGDYSRANLAHVAALWSACSVVDRGLTTEPYLVETRLLGPAGFSSLFGPTGPDRVLECGESAATCAAYRACVSGLRGPVPGSCAPGEEGSHCEGSLRVVCSLGVPQLGFDCASAGLRCIGNGSASAPAAVCSAGAACDGSNDRCEGADLVRCNRPTGVEVRYRCQDVVPGASCGQVPSLGVGCVLSGADPCTGAEPRCDGDHFVECLPPSPAGVVSLASSQRADGVVPFLRATSRVHTIDCSLLARRCDAAATAPDFGYHCLPRPDAECLPETDRPRCDGDALRVCMLDRWERVSCASVGMRTCVAEALPLQAHCAP